MALVNNVLLRLSSPLDIDNNKVLDTVPTVTIVGVWKPASMLEQSMVSAEKVFKCVNSHENLWKVQFQSLAPSALSEKALRNELIK